MEIDLSQFHAVFFEESFEGLDIMEQELLNLEDDTDLENVNTIFRAAHSIKGGSATFGFNQVAEFTHVMETLLDEMREGKREITREIIDLLLKSVDCLRGMLNKLQDGDDVNNDYVELVDYFNQLLSNGSNGSHGSNGNSDNKQNMINQNSEDSSSGSNENSDHSESGYSIKFVPENYILQTGNEPVRMFKELAGLGGLSVKANLTKVPNFVELDPELCFVSWDMKLDSQESEAEIRAVFEWVDDDCLLEVKQLTNSSSDESEKTNDTTDTTDTTDRSNNSEATIAENNSEHSAQTNVTADTLVANSKKLVPIKKQKEAVQNTKKPPSNASIRVGIDKVDMLIDLVGELVITQSMLGELGENFDVSKLEQLVAGLRELESNTRELQESVMRIRMLPIGFVFNRMPRMVRDLSAQLGKNIELVIKGEDTELDKTVMEQIGDPLTHLVRNAIDHGIESNDERTENGKFDVGKITLKAFHQGGNIIIEIEDNGGGINPDIIYKKAVEKGLLEDGVDIPEDQIIGLIMEPGFSTAEVVSDVSGRGVGLDVVKRNINNLGGRVDITSVVGKGTKFTIRLPLTLAILDGQLIRCANEIYVIPLASIVESIPLSGIKLTKIAGNMPVYKNGNEYIPIVDLRDEFDIKTEKRTTNEGLIAIVEGENRKIAIKIDELLGQQQVVIKSLESHYKCIQGVSGATILGDGRVSLILDIVGLSRRSADRANANREKVA